MQLIAWYKGSSKQVRLYCISSDWIKLNIIVHQYLQSSKFQETRIHHGLPHQQPTCVSIHWSSLWHNSIWVPNLTFNLYFPAEHTFTSNQEQSLGCQPGRIHWHFTPWNRANPIFIAVRYYDKYIWFWKYKFDIFQMLGCTVFMYFMCVFGVRHQIGISHSTGFHTVLGLMRWWQWSLFMEYTYF